MRENYRNSIASIKKFPQFTTMNVIDGQAGLIICASLIFYSLTIDNILNIIILLILAAVTVSLILGQGGLLQRAKNSGNVYKKAEANESNELDEYGKIIGNVAKESETNLDENGIAKISTINFDKDTLSIVESRTGIITAKVNNDATEGLVASDWKSSDESIAKISYKESTGIATVTGVGVGTSKISASKNGVTATCDVTVVEHIIGAYVNYDIPYTDMYTGYEFKATDGWRLLSRNENNDGTYNINIISTGVPAKLNYDYGVRSTK